MTSRVQNYIKSYNDVEEEIGETISALNAPLVHARVLQHRSAIINRLETHIAALESALPGTQKQIHLCAMSHLTTDPLLEACAKQKIDLQKIRASFSRLKTLLNGTTQ